MISLKDIFKTNEGVKKGDSSFASLVEQCGKNEYAAVAGIALTGIRVLSADDRVRYDQFAAEQLGRQMDVVHGLFESGEDFSAELRYLFDPERRHRIDVCILLRVASGDSADAEKRVRELGQYVLRLLRVNNRMHDFDPVCGDGELERLIAPFPFEHVAEIARREDLLPLDSVRKVSSKRLGFKFIKPRKPESAARENGAEIYFVFPWILHLENMERLCDILSLQDAPCLFSVCMRPYALDESDERELERRMVLCEKYAHAQLQPESGEDIRELSPYLSYQASMLLNDCSAAMRKMQDAAFLQAVRVASSRPFERELIVGAGATITEHSGHPMPLFKDFGGDNLFAGGFDWHVPETPEEAETARNNLERMEFVRWTPTVAPEGLSHWRSLVDITQAVAAFRLPIPKAEEFPGIPTTQYHPKPAPSDLPSTGLLIGEHRCGHRRRHVFFEKRDRRRHAYVVGQTGTGKSTLFLQMILQDIENGEGVGLIDPHGELAEEILECIPPGRRSDVVAINPGDLNFPVGINMLEFKNAFDKDFCINYLIEVFDQLYDLRETGGPIFEMYMRNALMLLAEQPSGFHPTVLDVPRLFQNRDFRKGLLGRCQNVYVKNFWEEEAERVGGDASLQNVSPYITSKLCRFVYNDLIRAIVGQRKSTIDFRRAMDEKKILLVNLRKGLLGETNAHFLGMVLVGKLLTAALSRTDTADKNSLNDFFLYVDEFQNVATPSFTSILSEARKYRLSLTLTNQYISQLSPKIVTGVFGNAGTLISFRVGSEDAKLLGEEFGRMVSENDLIGLSNYNAYVRLLVDGAVSAPFNLRTLLPKKEPHPEYVEQILDNSRVTYGKNRYEVEREIREAWNLTEPEKSGNRDGNDEDPLDFDLDFDVME